VLFSWFTAIVTGPPTDRKATAEAAASYTKVVTIATEMVAPGLIGLWIDRQMGTRVVFTVGGFVLGMVVGILQLVALTKEQPPDNQRNEQDNQRNEQDNQRNETVEDVSTDDGGTKTENDSSL